MEMHEDLLDILRILNESGIATTESVKHINIGTNRYISVFKEEILDGILRRGGSTCRFYEGGYGSGKSHIARTIANEAISNGFAVCYLDLSKEVNFENWNLVIKTILSRITISTHINSYVGIPSIIEYFSNDPEATNKIKNLHLPHQGYLNAIKYLVEDKYVSSEARAALHDYLLGERVTVAKFKQLGIQRVTQSLTTNNAEMILRTAIGTIKALGVPGSVIVFDENEHTFVDTTRDPPPRRVQEAANHLRRLIDGCFTDRISSTVIVFTSLPGFLNRCKVVYPALGQRLDLIDKSNRSWRCPVLATNEVLNISSPEDFLSELIEQFTLLIGSFCSPTPQTTNHMRELGNRIIDEQRGPSYKRHLLKAISGIALNSINSTQR